MKKDRGLYPGRVGRGVGQERLRGRRWERLSSRSPVTVLPVLATGWGGTSTYRARPEDVFTG